ncbi:MEDS domain-containing protein [Leifsonia sp. RAF41]|uniref:MEDS domain-containing protein n=1 Tax=Leifsonia sp. RAF41 TaxID=3233056 RepID=UPI003F956235
MPAGKPDVADPVTFAGGVLDHYRHVCAFVKGQTEADTVLDPFVQDGVDRGDRLLYLVDPAEPAAPLTRLRRLGYDTTALLDDRRCEVHTWAETYLRANFLHARHRHVVICSYDTSRFDGAFDDRSVQGDG